MSMCSNGVHAYSHIDGNPPQRGQACQCGEEHYGTRARDNEQPPPVSNDLPRCHALAIQSLVDHFGPEAQPLAKMMHARMMLGITRYGAALQPFNGRDVTRDVLEELLDVLAYSQQLIYELSHSQDADERAGAGAIRSVVSTLERYALTLVRIQESRRGR
jgi:hypothetical protein